MLSEEALMPLSEITRTSLSSISTATLATQLYRRDIRSIHMSLTPANPHGRRLVGEAFTLRYIPDREDLDHGGVYDNRTNPQRLAIEAVGPGQVLVIDCRGQRTAGALGAILATRLQVRGAEGVVVDGSVRDGSFIASLDMPVFSAGFAAPLSVHAHFAVESQVPIGCAEVAVMPGDIIVGDADGVVCIPRAIADEVAVSAHEQELDEEAIIERVRAGASIIDTYPPSDALLAEIRASRETN